MIYATDFTNAPGKAPCAETETGKRGFYRRCGNHLVHSVICLAATAGIFIAIGGAALAALAK